MPDIPLTEPQEAFVFSDSPHPAIVGGLGSGKSYAGTTRAVMRLLSRPGADVAYYMPTYDLLRLRAIPGVEDFLSAIGRPYRMHKTEYTVSVKGYGRVIFRSFDRPERIVAYEVADSIVDELDTLPAGKAAYVWRKVSERNRQKLAGHINSIGLVTTPDQGFSGFAYDRWVRRGGPDYEVISAPTASNPYLPSGYIEQIRANYDPLLAEMYLSGQFVSLSRNKVYHCFSRQRHHSDRKVKAGDHLHVGLDFNVGGTCASVWVIDGPTPIAVGEFVSHDTMDFCNRLAARHPGHKITVYPDASGKSGSTNASASDVAIIGQAGFTVDCPNSNPAIRDRVNSVNALLAHNRMLVNTSECPLLTNALESHGYGKDGHPEKFSAHPAIDDHNDAAGYFLHRKYPAIKPVIFTGIGSAS